MKYCPNKTVVSLILFSFAFSIGFCQEKSSNDNFVFKTEVHVDLLLHVFAHMDIGNDDANRYSDDYVKKILEEKRKLGLRADLKDKMDSIKDAFIPDHGLRMINFLPFFIGDYEEFIEGLNWLAADSKENHQNKRLNSFKTRYITTQEQRGFIRTLSGILDHEYQTFYRDYWKKEQERLAVVKEQFEGFMKTNGEKVFSPVMKKEKKNAVVYLCVSMTRWGRGFSSRDRFGGAVKLPEKREEFLPGFIWAIHEMTHQFSDALVMKAEGMDRSQSNSAVGSEGYRVHEASEYGASYADYLLFQKFLPEYLREYLLYFLDFFEKEAKDESMEELLKMFKTAIKLSDKSIDHITDYVNKL